MKTNIDLFTPVKLGAYELPNRLVMAPLTRNRAGEGNVPNEMNATYYAQRSSAGLIISEATQVFTPGARLSLYARNSLTRTSAGVEASNKCCSRAGRENLPTTMARWAHISSILATQWRASRCSFGYCS